KKQKRERRTYHGQVEQTEDRQAAPMKTQRISLHDESGHEQRHCTKNHLPARDHRWSQLHPSRFEQDIGERRAGSPEDDAESAPERHPPVETKKPLANNTHPADTN